MERAKGIDVAHHQKVINWEEVAAAGYKFAFIRASAVGTKTGNHIIDTRFIDNWTNAQETGLLLTAYHFFVPQINCTAQIDFFLTVFGNRTGNFPLALDFEHSGGLATEQVRDCIEQAVRLMEERTGQKPIIYSRASWWRRFVPLDSKWMNHILWVANYQNPDGPLLPKHWSTWKFWQWTPAGRVPGITTNVDLNWYNGTEDELRQFAISG